MNASSKSPAGSRLTGDALSQGPLPAENKDGATQAPFVTRVTGGLIIGLVAATPLLLAVGLLEAKWGTSDALWAETTFFATWLTCGLFGWYAHDLVRMTRVGFILTGSATSALPLLHLMLFGPEQSLRGTVGAVNLSLLAVGIVVVASASRIRRRSRSTSKSGTRLAALPSGGPTRSHTAIASTGALLISLVLSASASLLTSGTPLERVVVGVLLAPVIGLPTLFWALFAADSAGSLRRLSSLGLSSLGLLALASLVS